VQGWSDWWFAAPRHIAMRFSRSQIARISHARFQLLGTDPHACTSAKARPKMRSNNLVDSIIILQDMRKTITRGSAKFISDAAVGKDSDKDESTGR
jgi:hypothetical protein